MKDLMTAHQAKKLANGHKDRKVAEKVVEYLRMIADIAEKGGFKYELKDIDRITNKDVVKMLEKLGYKVTQTTSQYHSLNKTTISWAEA